MRQTNVYYAILVSFLSIIFFQISNKPKLQHPYADLTVEELIKKYEYPVEVHEVTTDDGYILTLHRIPHGRQNFSHNAPPVLLVPGVLQSAWDFVHYGPNHSLPFLLSEQGYDVWLGNVRGTTWSRRHVELDPNKDLAFWDYTVEEMGVHDVPAFIDYVLNTTKQDSLHYVGYSQGTMTFFIMGSEKSEYLSKVKFMSALSPAIFLKNPKSPIVQLVADNWRRLSTLFSFFNYQELFGANDPLLTYMKYICGDDTSIFINVCIHHLSLTVGDNYDEIDKSLLPLTFSKSPCGASLRQIVHIHQMVDSGNFSKYDFGTEENLNVYGQETPPHYNLMNIKVPIALYYSTNDWVINIKHMDRVAKTLPNVVQSYKVPSEKFSHGDFLFAKNVVNLLYNTVIDDISKY